MKKTLLVLPILGILLLWSCKDKQYLVGYYNYATFQQECRWDHFTDEKYKPNQKWLDSLATLQIKDSVTMKLFLGCYCGDSKKWVPRFYDLKADLPISTVEIISVDTTKKDEKKMAQAVGLKKIPTFIFYQGGDEIGRIVEKPKGGLEKSLFGVLKKCE